MTKATAEGRSNIALVKYWGRTNHALNLPLTSSISLTLDGLVTRTTVELDAGLKVDEVIINDMPASGAPYDRVVRHLDALRKRAGNAARCRVHSVNNFAASAGLASSASAFAALSVAGFAAMDTKVEPREMSTFARLGSGSAARSIFGGFVEWHAAPSHEKSFAEPLAPVDHMDVHDVAVTFSAAAKKVGSLEGHGVADTSPLLQGRLDRVPHLMNEVREAVRTRDFTRMGIAAEEDCYLMHAVMMTSNPSLLYWRAETVEGLRAVREWRADGLEAYATIDAGPNLHFLCMGSDSASVVKRVKEQWPEAKVHDSGPGEGARLVDAHLF